MSSPRISLVFTASVMLFLASAAYAQPTPESPKPAPASPEPAPEPPEPQAAPEPEPPAVLPAEPPVEHTVAGMLVERARSLIERGQLADAKLLLLESLQRAPDGPHVNEAVALLATVNRELDSKSGGPIDPYGDPYGSNGPAGPVDTDTAASRHGDMSDRLPPRDERRSSIATRAMLVTYGTAVGLASGLALTGPRDRRGDVPKSAIATGILSAALGAAGAHWMSGNHRPSMGQASALVWSGIWGTTLSLFATDIVTGVNDTTGNHLVAGGSLGALGGTLVGLLYVSNADPSVGDVALVDSMALYGTAGSLLVGVVLDPIQSEAYSVNGLIGTSAGLALGILAARRWDTTRARMFWIDAGATAGALVPWIAYPFVDDSTTSRQVIGGLSVAGLLAGGYLAWRWTRGIDRRSLKTPEPMAARAFTPGLVQHDSTGWRLGAPAIRPLANLSLLDSGPPRRGLILGLAGGYF